jgi:uncharacterized membrane protein (UPF0127 family)
MATARGVRIRATRVAFSSGAVIDAEIPLTTDQMLEGLRGRAKPSPMLFVFPHDDRRTMTMSGMTFPLDMIFIDGSGRVASVVSEATPGRLIVDSVVAARYCLELPAGWATGFRIQIGDRAMFTPLVR